MGKRWKITADKLWNVSEEKDAMISKDYVN